MANIKISELDELVTVANDDYLPIVDTSAGETKKIQTSNLKIPKIKNEKTQSDNDVYSCNYINNKIQDIVTNGSAAKCGYKIDNHEIYVSKKILLWMELVIIHFQLVYKVKILHL